MVPCVMNVKALTVTNNVGCSAYSTGPQLVYVTDLSGSFCVSVRAAFGRFSSRPRLPSHLTLTSRTYAFPLGRVWASVSKYTTVTQFYSMEPAANILLYIIIGGCRLLICGDMLKNEASDKRRCRATEHIYLRLGSDRCMDGIPKHQSPSSYNLTTSTVTVYGSEGSGSLWLAL
jgi:hypothetical protein